MMDKGVLEVIENDIQTMLDENIAHYNITKIITQHHDVTEELVQAILKRKNKS